MLESERSANAATVHICAEPLAQVWQKDRRAVGARL